ncbi:MAG: hypothetical protein JST26_03940 [Bacteroidetes bacterium]|nr:hypothetical protein [Bacteroidota bacterium]
MKKILLILLPFAIAFPQACNTPETPALIEIQPVDSFTVHDIDIGQQVQEFHYYNDSLLYSFNPLYKNLDFYLKDVSGHFHLKSTHAIETPAWSTFFAGDNQQACFMSRENIFSVYNSSGLEKQYALGIKHSFPFLKDSFMLLSSHDSPLLLCHDTLITAPFHSSLSNYNHYFHESVFAEFRILKDSICFLRSYLTKPKGLSGFCFPMAKYCFHNQTFDVIYPCYDTIYSFNRSSGQTIKHPIHNPDYKLPKPYTNKAFTAEYGSYQTQYELNNFQYSAIYFNPLTKHYVLFYIAPVRHTVKDRLPTPDDQLLQAIVLNNQFETTARYTFYKSFVNPVSYFFIPGKGLAMPVFKDHEHYETTQFFIYNF